MKRKSGTSAASILALLSAIHVYWAAGGKRFQAGTIPEVNGKAAFEPGPAMTLVVAAGLATAAAAVYRSGTVERRGRPAAAVALIFALRAIGDFRNVGFFQRERRSDRKSVG